MPRFQNWARTVSSSPFAWHTPRDEDALRDIVQLAARRDERVKVVGAAHSWSAIAAPDQRAVSLDAMQRLLHVDRAALKVRVQAGVRLWRLCDLLTSRGLSLPILGSVAHQSLAGAISTGTHGSSLTHGNLASQVSALRLITASGQPLELSGDDPRLAAARVGLGALGVLSEVTLDVLPVFRLRERAAALPWDEALSRLPELAHDAEYVKLWWLPHTDIVSVFTHTRTDAPPNISSLSRAIDQRLVNDALFRAVLAIGARVPSLVPPLNRLVARGYLKDTRRVGRVDQVLTLAMPPRHDELEFAIPLAHTTRALTQLRRLIQRDSLRVNFIVEARFVPADDAWMSPAYGRDTCQLGVYMGPNAPDLERYFSRAQNILMALGGRPHWGKRFDLQGPALRDLWPLGQRFTDLVAELDPDGRFQNPFLDSLSPRGCVGGRM